MDPLIHEDDLARQYGFKGGLVPGVTVYAWMTHPVVEALGVEWLEDAAILLDEGTRSELLSFGRWVFDPTYSRNPASPGGTGETAGGMACCGTIGAA